MERPHGAVGMVSAGCEEQLQRCGRSRLQGYAANRHQTRQTCCRRAVSGGIRAANEQGLAASAIVHRALARDPAGRTKDRAGADQAAQCEILMYLIDTVVFSELFKRRRHPGFLRWLSDKSE